MSRALTDAIGELVATGLDAKQLTLLLEVVALSTGNSTGQIADPAAERRRAYDRERKAKKRTSTGNSTGLPPDNDSALSLSSKPSSEIQENKKTRKIERGEKLPPEWEPKPEHFDAGEKLGFSRFQVLEQADDMRLWARSNEHRAVARKTDWDLTFHAWLRRNKPKNGTGNGHDRQRGESLGDLGRRLADEARQLELAAGARRPDDAFGRDPGSDQHH